MNEGLKLTIGLLLIANRAPALSWRDSQSDNPRSTVAEGIGVAVDRRCAAKMSVENLRSFGEIALLHEVDHSLHGFAFIDRVGNHAFEARAQANGLLRLLRWNAIGRDKHSPRPGRHRLRRSPCRVRRALRYYARSQAPAPWSGPG